MPPVRNSCARARTRVPSLFSVFLSLSLSISPLLCFSPSYTLPHPPPVVQLSDVKLYDFTSSFLRGFLAQCTIPFEKGARARSNDRRSERASSRVEKRLVDISARRLSGMTARPALSPPAPSPSTCPASLCALSSSGCPYYRRAARCSMDQ